MTAPLPACEWDASAAAAVSVSGARLRLRAMVAIGHSPAGSPVPSARASASGRSSGSCAVRRRTCRSASWTASPASTRPGGTCARPTRTKGERTAATMARRRARDACWCTGMGLDDDRLDEPGYDPRCAWRPATGTGVATDNPLRVVSPHP